MQHVIGSGMEPNFAAAGRFSTNAGIGQVREETVPGRMRKDGSQGLPYKRDIRTGSVNLKVSTQGLNAQQENVVRRAAAVHEARRLVVAVNRKENSFHKFVKAETGSAYISLPAMVQQQVRTKYWKEERPDKVPPPLKPRLTDEQKLMKKEEKKAKMRTQIEQLKQVYGISDSNLHKNAYMGRARRQVDYDQQEFKHD